MAHCPSEKSHFGPSITVMGGVSTYMTCSVVSKELHLIIWLVLCSHGHACTRTLTHAHVPLNTSPSPQRGPRVLGCPAFSHPSRVPGLPLHHGSQQWCVCIVQSCGPKNTANIFENPRLSRQKSFLNTSDVSAFVFAGAFVGRMNVE